MGPLAASIPISAAARVIVPQWLQCRSKKNTLSDNTAEGNMEEKMERGHSGVQQHSEREDINCVVRQLATWLLCYCVKTDLHHVILD